MAKLGAFAVLCILGGVLALTALPVKAEDSQAVPLVKPTAKPTASPAPRPVVENAGIATKTTITQEQLRTDNDVNTYDAIKNVAGVAQADAKAGGGADNLQIRGVHLPSNTGYRLDGWMSMENNIIMSPEDKDNVQVLKGAGALEYGLTSPAGVVNYYLKRAPKNQVSDFGVETNGYGQMIINADVGRRFPLLDGSFGFRTNIADGENGSYVKGASGTRHLEELAVDWANKRALVQLDLESFGIDITENASILQNKAVNNTIALPRIPNATTLLSGTWAHSVASGQNYGVRGVYAFSKAFSIVAEEGHSEAFRNQRFVPQIGTINLTTGIGTETVTLIRDQYDLNTTQDIELHLDDRAGNWLANHLVFGYSDSTRDFNNPTNGSASIKNVSIYAANPQVVVLQASGPLVFNPQDDNDWDYFVHDQMDLFGNRLHAIAGIRKINFFGDFEAPTTRKFNIDTQTVWAPGYGLVADITPNVSLYGDYVKSLQEGGSAPANSANAYQVLPPATAQQSEVGIREQSRHVSASFAYFSLELANALTNLVTNLYGLNGIETFDGLESTVAYNVGGGLSLAGSGQYMHAFQTASDPTINGFRPENTPILSGSVGFRYAPPAMRGTSVFADLLTTGPREINPQNQGIISSVTLLNTGFQFLVRNRDSRYNVIVTCKNCTNRAYWSSAVNGALGIGQPRTVQLYVRALEGRGAGP